MPPGSPLSRFSGYPRWVLIVGTAVVQGILTVFGLWLAGVPRPFMLGVIAGEDPDDPTASPLPVPDYAGRIGEGVDRKSVV